MWHLSSLANNAHQWSLMKALNTEASEVLSVMTVSSCQAALLRCSTSDVCVNSISSAADWNAEYKTKQKNWSCDSRRAEINSSALSGNRSEDEQWEKENWRALPTFLFPVSDWRVGTALTGLMDRPCPLWLKGQCQSVLLHAQESQAMDQISRLIGLLSFSQYTSRVGNWFIAACISNSAQLRRYDPFS